MDKKLLMIAIVAVAAIIAAGAVVVASQNGGSDVKSEPISIVTNPDFAPYEYMVEDKYEGIDMDIWRAIAKTMGRDLKINYMEFDSIVTAVQGGKFDVGVSGFTITEDRKEKVNFSDVYSTAYQAVVVKVGSEAAGYTTYDQLMGKTIGVETGTTGNYMALEIYGESSVKPFNTYGDVFQSLLQGKIDCAIVDNLVADSYVKKLGGLKVSGIELPGEIEEYGFVFNKNSTTFLKNTNSALAKLVSDGVIADIFDYYASVDYSPDADGYFTAHPEALKAIEKMDFSKKTVTIVTNPDFAPYEYMVGNYYEGIDMDIWRAICKTLDYNLEINYMEFDSIVTAVQGGKFDVGVSGFTITDDRKEKVNFSDVYSTAYQAVVVRQGSAEADYTSYEQLKGKTVGVETGTTGNYMALEIYGESSVKPFNTYGDVFQSLLQGKIDCAIVDNLVADSYVKKLTGLKVSDIELPGEIEEYGFVFNKSNTSLLEKTNAALSKLRSDGVIADIFDYYASVDYSPDADGYFTAHPEALKAIKSVDVDKKTVTVVTNPDFAPYEYMVGNDFEGIDMDIWRAICKTLDYNVEFDYMEFDSIVTAVQNGYFDVGASGFTITDERKDAVDFSDVYSTAYQAVVVKTDTAAAKVATFEGLQGMTVGVETGTTGNYLALEVYGEKYVKPFNTYGDVFQSLLQGKIDFAIVDNLVADSYVKKLADLKKSDIILPGEVEEYGFVFNKKNTDLLKEANAAMSKLRAAGVMDDIFNYYASVDYSPDAVGYFTAHPEALDAIEPIDKIKRTISIVTNPDFAPYEYMVGNEYEGIDMDIWRALCKYMDSDLEINYMEFDSIVTAVQGGKFDVGVSGFTITDERKLVVNFSDVYSTAYQAVVVREGSAEAGYTSYEQLKGKTIGVETGTTGNYLALDVFGESHVKPFNTYGDVFQSLLQGKLDCVIVDNLVADSYVKKLSGLKVSDIELPGEIEEYGFVFNKSDTELLALTNKALAQMKADGILDKIFDYYASVDYSPDADGFFTAHPEVLESIKAIDGSGGSSGGDDSKSKSFWERISQNLFEKERYNYILTGLENTIIITLIGLVIGLVLGILAAIVRSCHDINGNMKILNAICKVYITVIRGTPTMVQLLIIYFVVFASSSMNALIIAGIAFGINSGAYVAEIVRAGINAVPKGQLEAGRSLGLPFWPSMTKVIMPQAIRNILPALCNEGITLLKETSIAGYIGIVDLTKAAMLIRSQTYDAFIPLLVVAAIYLIIVLVLQYLVGRLERRLNDAY